MTLGCCDLHFRKSLSMWKTDLGARGGWRQEMVTASYIQGDEGQN